MNTFSETNFHHLCDQLAKKDKDLRGIIKTYGYPPMWTRPNTFESLVHIILEQQVSLASAKAALEKLREKIKKITPAKVLVLTDEEMKTCYFSRQKMNYARHLAAAIVDGHLDLKRLETLPDQEIRKILVRLKGIGDWTVDVYMMFVLQRTDLFPVGDLAAVNTLKKIKNLSKETSSEEILEVTEKWKPYRTVATMILWHYYLSLRKK